MMIVKVSKEIKKTVEDKACISSGHSEMKLSRTAGYLFIILDKY